jgi:hypothetical protein
MTQKALLQSAGDGSAIPAGYVGELTARTTVNVTNLTGSTVNAATLLLTSGNWLIFFNGQGGGSTVGSRVSLTISTSSATEDTDFSTVGTVSSISQPFSMSMIRVISTSGQNVYLTARAPDSGTTMYLSGRIQAIRIS